MQAFGWTWEYVDELDFPRVQAIYRGLSKHPPTHWCAAAFVKFKPLATSGGNSAPKPSETFEAFGGRLLDG